jgi:hypothetical protein
MKPLISGRGEFGWPQKKNQLPFTKGSSLRHEPSHEAHAGPGSVTDLRARWKELSVERCSAHESGAQADASAGECG